MTLSLGLGVINLAYVVMALGGTLRAYPARWLGLLLLYIAVRSVFLGTS